LLADGAKFWVAGACTPLTAFKVRTMNFGQEWCTAGIEDVAYDIAVPLQCLEAVMQRRNADFATVLADPEQARLAIAKHGHETLRELEQCLAGQARAAQLPRWVLNTIVSAEVREGVVVFGGMARAPVDGDDIKYQDA
jgi:hypothetical protein